MILLGGKGQDGGFFKWHIGDGHVCWMHSLNHKAAALRRFKPLLDRVLVERMLPETVSEQRDVLTVWHTPDYHVVQKTKSGLMIPEKAQGKVNEAVVIAVGPGARDKVMGGGPLH